MQTQIHGGDIYSKEYRMDFSANINPLGTPESVMDAACRGVRLSGQYPDIRCRELCMAIAEREGTEEKNIICGNGAAELIFLLVQALRPRKALLVSPGFAEYELALRSVGCQIEFYDCNEAQGFVIGETYTELLKADLDMIFLCNPANPTGVLIPQSLLETIQKTCRERQILLVADECFNSFLPDGAERSLVRHVKENPYLFVLKAFTKMYAMAGLRLGYGLCSNQKILDQMRRCIQPWNVSIPAQMAGTAALKECSFEEQSRNYIRKAAKELKKGLEELGMRCFDSRANYLFFRGPEDLYERCSEQGILIRDCSNYRGLCPGYFRVAVKTVEENAELLRTLRGILQG